MMLFLKSTSECNLKKQTAKSIKSFLFKCILTLKLLLVGATQLNSFDNVPIGIHTEKSIHFKILSWNIAMLPIIDRLNGKNERAKAIAKELSKNDYHVIVFQEAFASQARSIINNSLKYQYPYSYGPFNKSGFSMKFNSGIWILSKVALEVKHEIEFTDNAGFDFFARKGAVLLEGTYNGTTFQIIAAHLQDDEYPQKIRISQFNEIYQNLLIHYSDTNKPQIICGDFNTDDRILENYSGMLNHLHADDGELSGNLKITYDDISNDLLTTNIRNPRRIDYILTRNSNCIKKINRKITVLKSRWGKNKMYLSDHNGVEAEIVFGE
jgi:endonuclease/exonuclease/phosphatase family metal-dependent hydrolase